MKEQRTSVSRQSRKTILLLVVIAILGAVVIFQQVQISYLRPIALQETKTELAWGSLFTQLYGSELAYSIGPNSSAPSLIAVPINQNLTCLSINQSCHGYDYYFPIENLCKNDTYYGTCNFLGGAIFWYDISTNVLFTTATNVSIPQGEIVVTYGDWPKNLGSSLAWGNALFVEVSSSGGWTTASMASWINY